MASKFARRSDGLNAKVCKDIKPSVPKSNNPVPDSSSKKYQKIVLRIPDEFAFALLEMYEGKGLQYAIMHHIKATVTPLNLDKD